MGFYLTGYKYTLPSLFSLEQVSDIHATSYTYGQIEPNRNSPFFPLRSDEKIMRSDVKEAIVLVNELIEDLGGNIEQNTPLFIANGAFIEDPNKYLKESQVFMKHSLLTCLMNTKSERYIVHAHH